MTRNNDFLSLVMKQRYQIDDNGKTTTISYCIQRDYLDDIYLQKEYYRNEPSIGYSLLISEININEICELDQDDHFKINSEGQFFVKTSNYNNSLELDKARILAIEDDIRFKLNSNTLNLESCPELKEFLNFLNLTISEFLKQFLLESKSIYEIYSEQVTNKPSFDESFEKIVKEYTEEKKEEENIISSIEASQWIDNTLEKAISNNSNIKFIKLDNCNNAALVITPNLNENGAAGETLLYNDNNIIKLLNSFPVPVNGTGWAEGIHGILHSFIDHVCENGFYQCSKEEILKKGYIPSLISQQAGVINFENIQSLLPWDLAALRYTYGAPEEQDNIYQNLSSASGLKEIFGYNISDKSTVTLSSVGSIIIDIQNVKTYDLDLRYDYRSNITNSDLETSFFLSYDTKVSQILINSSGNITLSDEFKTNITINNECYNLIIRQCGYQSNIITQIINDDCIIESTLEINLFNFDQSLHFIGDRTTINHLDYNI